MEFREIADAFAGGGAGSGVRLRKGVISAVGTGVASVKIGGDTEAIPDVPVLNSYSPVVNDVVTVLQNGPALLIVGKVGAPAKAPDSELLDGMDSTAFAKKSDLDLLGWGQMENHSTHTSFATISRFGVSYVQGATDGPGFGAVGSIEQYYVLSMSLGAEYPYAQYVCQIAYPRNRPGASATRYREAGAWGPWKIVGDFPHKVRCSGQNNGASFNPGINQDAVMPLCTGGDTDDGTQAVRRDADGTGMIVRIAGTYMVEALVLKSEGNSQQAILQGYAGGPGYMDVQKSTARTFKLTGMGYFPVNGRVQVLVNQPTQWGFGGGHYTWSGMNMVRIGP